MFLSSAKPTRSTDKKYVAGEGDKTMSTIIESKGGKNKTGRDIKSSSEQ
jgi:hypothetical protein